MANVIDQLGKGAHVGVIRLRSLGDCVLTTPALTLLKRYRPDLRIGVAVEPRFASIFEGNPDVDDILAPTIREIRRFSSMLCLNLHGGTRSLALTLASGARFKAGFAHYRYSSVYGIQIPTAQEVLAVDRKVHTAEHLASAMFYLGVPKREIPRSKLQAKHLKTPFPYAIIHPMASGADKTWPPERFLELAGYLREHGEMEPIFIGTPAEDMTPFRRFRVHTGSLEDTKALIARAALFIGNDSGPAHMAAALDVPLIVFFAASDPVAWAPWRANAETIIAENGILSISTSDVLQAFDRIRVKA